MFYTCIVLKIMCTLFIKGNLVIKKDFFKWNILFYCLSLLFCVLIDWYLTPFSILFSLFCSSYFFPSNAESRGSRRESTAFGTCGRKTEIYIEFNKHHMSSCVHGQYNDSMCPSFFAGNQRRWTMCCSNYWVTDETNWQN